MTWTSSQKTYMTKMSVNFDLNDSQSTFSWGIVRLCALKQKFNVVVSPLCLLSSDLCHLCSANVVSHMLLLAVLRVMSCVSSRSSSSSSSGSKVTAPHQVWQKYCSVVSG